MTTTSTTHCHRLELPNWRPALASELINAHRMVAHRRKRADAHEIATAATLAGIPLVAVPTKERVQRRELGIGAMPGDPTPRRRRVRIHIETLGRPLDPDAALKSLLDALVSAGLLVDDSAKWAEWSVPTWKRAPLRTVIDIEDLGP